MLGVVLYEAIDLVYHIGKIGYDGTKYIYNWYYAIDENKDDKEVEITNMKKRIEQLENLVENKN